GGVVIMLERAEYHVGIAVDVDEARLRKHFEQQPDARRMRRRFENQRARILDRQLAQEPEEGRLPFVDLGRRHTAKREVSLIPVEPAGKRDPRVHRAEADQARRELVLLRRVERKGHVVHRPRVRQQRPEPAGVELFGGQKGEWVDHLVGVGERELFIQGQQVVQVGGAAAPVAEDENRRTGELRAGDLGAVALFLPAGIPRVHQAEGRDERRPVPVGRVDGETVLAQQTPPRAGRAAGEVVVTQAPAVLELHGRWPSRLRESYSADVPGGTNSSMRAASSSVRWTSRAPRLSSSCSIIRGPMMTEVTAGLRSAQALAKRARETPFRAASGRSSSTMSSRRSNLGFPRSPTQASERLLSLGLPVSRRYLPVSQPPSSGLQTMLARPNFRVAGK